MGTGEMQRRSAASRPLRRRPRSTRPARPRADALPRRAAPSPSTSCDRRDPLSRTSARSHVRPERDPDHVDRQPSEENSSVGGEPVGDEPTRAVERRPHELGRNHPIVVEQRDRRGATAPRRSRARPDRGPANTRMPSPAARAGPHTEACRVGVLRHVGPRVCGGPPAGPAREKLAGAGTV